MLILTIESLIRTAVKLSTAVMVHPEACVRPGPPGKAWVDLQGLARFRLKAQGVVRCHWAAVDVFADPKAYSHRRQGGQAGRQIAAILPAPLGGKAG